MHVGPDSVLLGLILSYKFDYSMAIVCIFWVSADYVYQH